MAPKRKSVASDADEPDSPKAAKPKKAKATKALKEPSTGADGYTTHPPSLIYKCSGETGKSKIAAFDLDGTLVATKTGGDFPSDAEDWKFVGPDVAQVVQGLHKDGHKIVIFTNQGGIKSALDGKMATKVKGRISQVVDALGVPADVYMATLKDEMRKPETGMWKFMVETGNGGVEPDLAASFFVGDAAGREADLEKGLIKDFAASDKEFAEAIGLPFKVPQDMFSEEVLEGNNAKLRVCFEKLSTLLFAKQERMRGAAFRKVALALGDCKEEVTSGKEAGKLKGIGKGSVALIDEWLATGKMQALADLLKPEAKEPGGTEEEKNEKGKALAFL